MQMLSLQDSVRQRLTGVLRPIQALRRSYLPLLMVYFAYGALGLVDVSRDMWIKERLTLSAADLAGLGVWLSLPWTMKMVFGQLVDCFPIFGSQRRSYVLIGAGLVATGLVVLAGAAGGWITFVAPDQLYVIGAMLMVLGAVVQDVVADAMSTEVVPRFHASGVARPESEVRVDLGMVQVLGRLALAFGILSVAGLSGWLAQYIDRQTVFLVGLVVPAISLLGLFFIEEGLSQSQQPDRRIILGGLAFGAVVVAVALGNLPFAQEAIFAISMTVICTMLVFVTRSVDPKTRRAILCSEHRHLRVPGNSFSRRRLFLVDARCAEIR